MANSARNGAERALAQYPDVLPQLLYTDPNGPKLTDEDSTEVQQDFSAVFSRKKTAQSIELNNWDMTTQNVTVSSSAHQTTEALVNPNAVTHVYKAESTIVSVSTQPSSELEELQTYVDLDFILENTCGFDVTKGSTFAKDLAQGSVNSGSNFWNDKRLQPNKLRPATHYQVAATPSRFGPSTTVHHFPSQCFLQNRYSPPATAPFHPQYNMPTAPPQVNLPPPSRQAIFPPPPSPFPMMSQPYSGVKIKKEKPDKLPSCAKPSPLRLQCFYPGCFKVYTKRAFFRNHLKTHTAKKPNQQSLAENVKLPTVLEIIHQKENRLPKQMEGMECPTCHHKFTLADLAAALLKAWVSETP